MQKIIITLVLLITIHLPATHGYCKGVIKTDGIVNATGIILKRVETSLPDTVKLNLLKQLVDQNMEIRTTPVAEWINKEISLSHHDQCNTQGAATDGYCRKSMFPEIRLLKQRSCI